MSIFDNRSDQVVKLVHAAAITTDTTTNSDGVDTADFEGGIMFALTINAYTDGTYVMTLQDSPDDSVWTALDSDKVIGPAVSLAAATSASGGLASTLGAFSHERYVRASIVSTSTTSGATPSIVSIASGEYLPAAAQS